jgi:hypothetical protein
VKKLLLIVVLAALPFVPALIRGEVFVFRDHFSYFLPLRHFTAESLREGELPLWNPYNASGEPWLANPQTGIFYPPAWIFVVLPFTLAYTLYLGIHVAWTGIGAFVLFRQRATEGAALTGAVMLMLSGPALSLIDVSNNLGTFAWIPWVLACALRRPDKGRYVQDALVLLMCFLGGEPFLAAFAALAYAVIVRSRRVVIVGALALALGAVQIFPFLEWLQGSNRIATATLSDRSDAMHPAMWLRMFVPQRLMIPQFIPLMYAGVLTAIAAIAGLLRGRRALGWLALVVIAVVVSAGPELVYAMPIRFPSRMVVIGMIGVAGLATLGLDLFKPRYPAVWILLAMLAAADVLRVAGPLLQSAPFESLQATLDPSIARTTKLFRLPQKASPLADPIPWLYGYQNLYGRRFDTGSRTPAVPLRYEQLFDAASRGRTDLISFLSGGVVLSDADLPLRGIARLREVRVYANDGALPMITVWTSARGATADEAFSNLMKRVAPGTLHVTPPRSVAGRPSVSGVANGRFTLSSVAFEVNAAGIVMITQRDAPGWTVTVDGQERPRLLANGIFRAVEVGPGRHRVEWKYRPRSLILGAVVSTLAVLVAVYISRRSLSRHMSSLCQAIPSLAFVSRSSTT